MQALSAIVLALAICSPTLALAHSPNEGAPVPVPAPVAAPAPDAYVEVTNPSDVIRAIADDVNGRKFQCLGVAQNSNFNSLLPGSRISDYLTSGWSSVSRRNVGQPVLKFFSDDPSTRVTALVTTDASGTHVDSLKVIAEQSSQLNEGTIAQPDYVTVWTKISDFTCSAR